MLKKIIFVILLVILLFILQFYSGISGSLFGFFGDTEKCLPFKIFCTGMHP